MLLRALCRAFTRVMMVNNLEGRRPVESGKIDRIPPAFFDLYLPELVSLARLKASTALFDTTN